MFDYKTRPDLSVNNKDIEANTVEILSSKKRDTLTSMLYRPPCGEIEPFETFLNSAFSQTKSSF